MGGAGQSEGGGNLNPWMVGSVLYGADRQVEAWMATRIPGFSVQTDPVAIGVIKGGDIVAGLAYSNFNGIHCEISIAAVPGTRWADRRTLAAIFGYPFSSLGCKAITAVVAASNLASLNLCAKLGFKPEAFVKYASHDGSAACVLKMEAHECRWLRE